MKTTPIQEFIEHCNRLRQIVRDNPNLITKTDWNPYAVHNIFKLIQALNEDFQEKFTGMPEDRPFEVSLDPTENDC